MYDFLINLFYWLSPKNIYITRFLVGLSIKSRLLFWIIFIIKIPQTRLMSPGATIRRKRVLKGISIKLLADAPTVMGSVRIVYFWQIHVGVHRDSHCQTQIFCAHSMARHLELQDGYFCGIQGQSSTNNLHCCGDQGTFRVKSHYGWRYSTHHQYTFCCFFFQDPNRAPSVHR